MAGMAWTMGAKHIGAAALVLAALVARPAAAAVPADTELGARQAQALAAVAQDLQPLRPYDAGDRSDCVIIGDDGNGLVAQLELDRRSLPGGVDPATAEPWAAHIAAKIAELVGTGGVEQRCSWDNAGAPGIMQATADISYALVRYGSAWSAATKEAIRVAAEDASWPAADPYLANGGIDLVAAKILVGDALGSTALLDLGKQQLHAMIPQAAQRGLGEVNAPMYTAEHFSALLFLQVVSDEAARNDARILMDYELLLQAHLYLPGGGLGAPQSRDYAGGAAEDSNYLRSVLWVLVGDPAFASLADPGATFAVAATDHAIPEPIRAIFLDKSVGYSFLANTLAQQGTDRTPAANYDFGNGPVDPWQAVVLPGGGASIGLSYGYRLTALGVTSGTYLRGPDGTFQILYQYQPLVTGDTDDIGDPITGSGLNADPDDFTSELYDFERMRFGTTTVTLWDPTTQSKPPGVIRTYQDTRVHLPSWDAAGGASLQQGDWRVGKLGSSYVAFLPLGTVGLEEPRDGGAYTFMRLDGPSGGIVELAAEDAFPTLADYAQDLGARYVAFSAAPLAVELDARDPDSGELVRIRLEHSPERRLVGGVEQDLATLDGGPLSSPWVSWDAAAQRLRLARECYPIIDYDWAASTIAETAPAPGCETGGAGGQGGTSAAGGSAGSTAGPPSAEDDSGGCACRSAAGHGSGASWPVPGLAAGLLLSSRRRNRRRAAGPLAGA